jgi:acylphosphatase
MEICFQVFGNVQGVFFRKTFCIAAKKRGFRAGATNNRVDIDCVICTVIGDSEEEVNKFIDELVEIAPLNSAGASIDRVQILEEVHSIERHDFITDGLEEDALPEGMTLNI